MYFIISYNILCHNIITPADRQPEHLEVELKGFFAINASYRRGISTAPFCCACADNRAAAERWLSVLEGAGLRVVHPHGQPDATTTSSSGGYSGGMGGMNQAGEADGQLQDRYATVPGRFHLTDMYLISFHNFKLFY